MSSLLRRLLDDTDFVVGQTVQLVDQLVNPPVCHIDLTLDGRLVRGRLRTGEVLVQVEYSITKCPTATPARRADRRGGSSVPSGIVI